MMFCLEPARALSVGFGPVFFPHVVLEWCSHQWQHVANLICQLHVISLATARGVSPILHLLANLLISASKSCLIHNPSLGADLPKLYLFLIQRECRSEPFYHQLACDRDANIF